MTRDLPIDFLDDLRRLERSFLESDDPIRQSGFGGGAERWRQERSPILDAVDADGEILDVGCANGYLLECLVSWGRERGIALVPFGLDFGPRLIERARQRLHDYADHFLVGNAWTWRPPRRFRYVYSLYDCVPEQYAADYVRRLAERFVWPGGRLIIGAYGSRSRNEPPYDVGGLIRRAGLMVTGTAAGGQPPITSFVWCDVG